MTKRTRTILFLICLLLFILVAPTAVFYSQGYRFDFDSKKITQTGAFYFKIWPKSVNIYLDGKLKKKTDFFFGSTLIENLLPKKYKIEIKKEGYYPWEKSLEIKEKQVTEVKNIVLVPENPEFKILTNDLEDFFFLPNEREIILKTPTNQSSTTEQNWELKLFELDKNLKSYLIKGNDISSKKSDLVDLKFSSDSKRVLFQVGLREELKNFIVEIDKTPPNLISLDFLGPDVWEISFHPEESQKIFFSKIIIEVGKKQNIKTTLFEADYNKKEVSSLPILENLITYEISEGEIYWLSEEGFLFKSDFSGTNQEKISLNPFPVKNEIKYQLSLNSSKIILKEGDVLYLFNQDLKSFEKLFENLNDLRFSPDLKKMVYFSDYEIWILFLEGESEQPKKEVGEALFLTRFSEEIEEIFWYTSNYLIFNIGNKIKIAEIDERDRINIVDLAEFKKPKIFFNQTDKKLYILSEGNLFVSENLIQ